MRSDRSCATVREVKIVLEMLEKIVTTPKIENWHQLRAFQSLAGARECETRQFVSVVTKIK